MKTLLKFAVIAFVALLVTTNALAQEWTKAQTEVWKVVQDSWTKWQAGDVEGTMAFFHDRYQGWSDDAPLPVTKEQVKNLFTEMKSMMKIEHFMLNPARILVMENTAVVDYYFMYSMTMTMGDKKEMKDSMGKNVEFYVKEGGKWLLIGDMTVHEKMKGM